MNRLLARLLKKIDPLIVSQNIREGGGVRKGYRWKQFEDEVKRYIRPPGGSQTATSLQPNVSAGYRQNGNATPDANVADEKDPKAPATNGCSGVADDAPLTEEEAWVETIKIEKENREATAATEKMVRQEENIARKMEEMWDNNSWEIMGKSLYSSVLIPWVNFIRYVILFLKF